jgi:hypothetical protein
MCECGFLNLTAEGWVAVGTVALAIVTAALAVFTFKLWKSTGNLVRGAEENAEKQLRAYVSAKTHTPQLSPGAPRSFVQLTIINHGQTPARNAQVAAAVEFLPYPLPANHVLNPGEFQTQSATIHPGAEAVAGASGLGLTHEQIYNVNRGQSPRLYVFGVIRYVDVFGKTRETRFAKCASEISGQGTRWENAAVYNDAT